LRRIGLVAEIAFRMFEYMEGLEETGGNRHEKNLWEE